MEFVIYMIFFEGLFDCFFDFMVFEVFLYDWL